MRKASIFISTFLFIILTSLGSSLLLAQNTHLHKHQHQRCGTTQHTQHLIQQNPQFLADWETQQLKSQTWIDAHRNTKQLDEILTIPVVFHVVYTEDIPASNISDEQIYSQLAVMNEDFRRMNEDTINTPSEFRDVAADTEIEFCLATRTPNDLPSTGITRTATTKSAFDSDSDEVKFTARGGIDAWPTNRYLNVWICNDLTSDEVTGILGYAQFPGMAANTDGIVVIHSAFGTNGSAEAPYDKGRSMVHEIGHWLDLIHTWGDFGVAAPSCTSDDRVDDTPRTQEPNFGCDASSNQCTNEVPDYNDMIQNYMDYSDDACTNMFTSGQKERMRAALATNNRRNALLTSTGCKPFPANSIDLLSIQAPMPFDTICDTKASPIIEVASRGIDTLYVFYIDVFVNNKLIQNIPYTEKLAPFDTASIELPPIDVTQTNSDIQNLKVVVRDPNGLPDIEPDNTNLGLTFFLQNAQTDLIDETFESNTFIFTQISFANYDNKGGFSFNFNVGQESGGCVYIDNFNYTDVTGNNADEIVIEPAFDLANIGHVYLNFHTAYAKLSETEASDTLEVRVATGCFPEYETIYQVYGEDLTTAPPTDEPFVPTDEQWRAHSIDLGEFIEENSVRIRIRHLRGAGNNFYIDNLNLNPIAVGMDEQITEPFNQVILFPNPTIDLSSVQLQLSAANKGVSIQIINKLGKVIQHNQHQLAAGKHTLPLSIDELPMGVYFVKVKIDEQIITKKLVLLQ